MSHRAVKPNAARAAPRTVERPPPDAILQSLQKAGSQSVRDAIGRYGITGRSANTAFGVPVGKIRDLALRIGRDHSLALVLWDTGQYEARLLAAFVDEPDKVTSAQMDRWRRDFDNWAVCDTVCFHLFDRLPDRAIAFKKIERWAEGREEFAKRAAFALLASVALHDKKERDGPFVRCLPLMERHAADPRNFVKKAVSWALRGVARRNRALNALAASLAKKLAEATEPSARWVGRDVLRQLRAPRPDRPAQK